jgi:hypothetical protein
VPTPAGGKVKPEDEEERMGTWCVNGVCKGVCSVCVVCAQCMCSMCVTCRSKDVTRSLSTGCSCCAHCMCVCVYIYMCVCVSRGVKEEVKVE